MLEAAVLLELVLGKYIEAAIIAALLVFNAALGLFQEGRAQATLAALKSRLALNASVRRDGAWRTIPAAELVPGDVVKLSLGSGGCRRCSSDRRRGPARPVHDHRRIRTHRSGRGRANLRRGVGAARRSSCRGHGDRRAHQFGRTAELVRTAHVVSSQQKAVLRVVRNLAAFNGVVIVLLVAYAWFLEMPLDEIIPLVLTAVLASIPVALPATFTLASAIGARALAKQGVLPTRLSAVDEAATMDVLCSDKTGTLTRNDADGHDRPSPCRVRRGARSGAGRAREFGWRTGPRGRGHSDCGRGQVPLPTRRSDEVRAVRSGDKDVRGDRRGSGPAARSGS